MQATKLEVSFNPPVADFGLLGDEWLSKDAARSYEL